MKKTLAQTRSAPHEVMEWMQRLVDNGLLHWKHGDSNAGLLLATLLDVCGWQGNIHTLMDALPTTSRRIRINDILGVMGALGYRVQSYRVNLEALKPEELPGLFVPDERDGWRRGIVIREISNYGMIWEDGRQQYRGHSPGGSGKFYRFIRNTLNQSEDAVDATPKLSWLAKMFERFRPLIFHALALSLIMHLFTLAVPLFVMVVYDRIINTHASGTLPLLTMGVVLALIIEGMVRTLRIRIAGWIGARSGLLATGAMLQRLLFLPAPTIEQASISSQQARIRAFESVRDFITGPIFLTVLEIPFLGVLVMIIALLAGPVALVAVLILLAQVIMLLVMRSRWKKLGYETAHAAAMRQQALLENITHREDLYAVGISNRMIERFRMVSWQAANAHFRFNLNAAVVQHLSGLITVIAGVATIVWSLERIWAGQMTGGAMVAVMIITWRVLYPLQVLGSVLPHLEQIRGSLKQVAGLMSLTPEAHAANVVLADHSLGGNLMFHNVGLRYNRKSDPVFMGLTMEINAGEVVAIYGGNGTGKSSILKLLLGLYAPAIGNIRFDGVDHRQFDPRSLRRQIAYLPQHPEILPGTIAENLRIYEPLAEDYRLRQALLWADLWDAVEALPKNIHTKLGKGHYVPSTGFAYRLCLARLYLARRPVILCDELPAQVMNSATGQRFKKFLQESNRTSTVLYVTHRQDWVEFADKVIWLRQDMRPVVAKPEQALAAERKEI